MYAYSYAHKQNQTIQRSNKPSKTIFQFIQIHHTQFLDLIAYQPRPQNRTATPNTNYSIIICHTVHKTSLKLGHLNNQRIPQTTSDFSIYSLPSNSMADFQTSQARPDITSKADNQIDLFPSKQMINSSQNQTQTSKQQSSQRYHTNHR